MKNKKADVYTRTGDKGTTALFGGSRTEKDSKRVEAYGTLDELCAIISVVKTQNVTPEVLKILSEIQNYCHDINAEIASDKQGRSLLTKIICKEDVAYIEQNIDKFDSHLPKLDHFIVPDIKASAAFLNLARTVCRRAERRLWALSREMELNENIIIFINRLSDLLFTLMRFEGEKRKETD
ncbi:cob(I)yrinic acid a,c-diamide adenosyltransferase [candidate division KSB1 bacterium]|nr:cob(I)yrinic acid a,c-diamide adenosyltransferase [candidate division KSB1 bacterium]